MNFFKKPGTQGVEQDAPYVPEDLSEPVRESAPRTAETERSSFGGVNLGGNNIELKVVRPEKFESVSQIADHLLKHRTVVLNLEATNKDTARRLIDFLSGVAYSIDGQLKRVANNTYIITPDNVDVSDAGIRGERREMSTPAPAAAPAAAPAEPAAAEPSDNTMVYRTGAGRDGLMPDIEY